MFPKKVADLTADDIKKDNASLFDAIQKEGFDLGAKVQSAESNPQTIKLTSELKVLRHAIKMNQVALAETMLAEGKTDIDIMTAVIEKATAEVGVADKVKKEEFTKTIPNAAGAGSAADANEVDTKEKAIETLMAKDGKLSRANAIRAARREYPNLFMSTFLQASTPEGK